ncbi:MAG: LysM peptidoglycan-binding domain-containing protein [Chloroflexi bacterium]|nr:LysM peptidoglycan-binding domain-containing protein [Chloroflexota bacterium]
MRGSIRWFWWAGFAIGLIVGIWGALHVNTAVHAAPPREPLTPFPTPTPREDGAIIYRVQPGDTLWRIAAIAGVSVEQLRALNKLTSDVVTPGQILILGYAVPEATPTPAQTPTPTPLLPTPTPEPRKGTICVFLYEDDNGNARYDEDLEPYLAGGQVSLRNRSNTVDLTGTTRADEPLCFEDLPEGEYNIAMGIPEGLNPTTATNWPVRLEGGDVLYVTFGAQPNAESPWFAQGEGGSSVPIFALVGVGLILLGLGLAWYAYRSARPPYLQR